MIVLCLLLALVGLLVSLPATAAARALGHRLNALDAPGVAGQVKVAARRVPNTGGIGIFFGVALPMLAGILAVTNGAVAPLLSTVPDLEKYLPGIREESAHALWLLAGLAILHVVGLIDDRRPLPPWPKLILMLGF